MSESDVASPADVAMYVARGWPMLLIEPRRRTPPSSPRAPRGVQSPPPTRTSSPAAFKRAVARREPRDRDRHSRSASARYRQPHEGAAGGHRGGPRGAAGRDSAGWARILSRDRRWHHRARVRGNCRRRVLRPLPAVDAPDRQGVRVVAGAARAVAAGPGGCHQDSETEVEADEMPAVETVPPGGMYDHLGDLAARVLVRAGVVHAAVIERMLLAEFDATRVPDMDYGDPAQGRLDRAESPSGRQTAVPRTGSEAPPSSPRSSVLATNGSGHDRRQRARRPAHRR